MTRLHRIRMTLIGTMVLIGVVAGIVDMIAG
jgi:hypothetical protein